MSYLFFGLFILISIAGYMSWTLNRPPGDRQGIIGDLMSVVGVSKREKENKEDVVGLSELNKAKLLRLKEGIDDMVKSQAGLMEDVKDQQRFLEDANIQLTNVAGMVNTVALRNNVDMLRIKDMMKDYNDKNRLLIDRGKELIRFNKEQLENRKKMVDVTNLEKADNSFTMERLKQQMQASVNQRLNFVKRSKENASSMRNVAQNFDRQLKDVRIGLKNTNDTQVIEHLKDIQSKNDTMLINARANEERLRDLNQQQEQAAQVAIDRVNEFIEHSNQRAEDAHENMLENKRVIAERTADQMQRLKDMRSR